MKAEIYELEIYSDMLALTHGFSSTIREIYVPEHRLSINNGGKYGNVFTHEDRDMDEDGEPKRYKDARKIKDIEIDDMVVKKLLNFLVIFKDVAETVDALGEEMLETE